MTWKGKNILITGSTHFIAGHLVERLVMLGSQELEDVSGIVVGGEADWAWSNHLARDIQGDN